ncbi:MAG: diaminopimelate epimerase [Candidatus Solibacter usitatus]|nr:diaminopimelate epimerase [Candidatus Solibacter usitatus]
MTKIPFAKAHGARNDFLLTWAQAAPAQDQLARAAVALCDRNAGVGADGWLLVTPPSGGNPASIRLINSDGSDAEISGNGTRCAAAFLCDADLTGPEIVIQTGAGPKHLRLLERRGLQYQFEMNMGEPRTDELRLALPCAGGEQECTILWVGNPQCALLVDSFDFDWKALGAEIERHAHFPNRTNVSFIRVQDRHTLDVRFYERGAGFTMSSGTGSTGAVAAAMARGLAESPVTVHTLAGPLEFRAEGAALVMTGPAEIVAGGEFYFEP